MNRLLPTIQGYFRSDIRDPASRCTGTNQRNLPICVQTDLTRYLTLPDLTDEPTEALAGASKAASEASFSWAVQGNKIGRLVFVR